MLALRRVRVLRRFFLVRANIRKRNIPIHHWNIAPRHDTRRHVGEHVTTVQPRGFQSLDGQASRGFRKVLLRVLARIRNQLHRSFDLLLNPRGLLVVRGNMLVRYFPAAAHVRESQRRVMKLGRVGGARRAAGSRFGKLLGGGGRAGRWGPRATARDRNTT